MVPGIHARSTGETQQRDVGNNIQGGRIMVVAPRDAERAGFSVVYKYSRGQKMNRCFNILGNTIACIAGVVSLEEV